MTIQSSIQEIIKVEGGYVNDPKEIERAINAALLFEARQNGERGSCVIEGCVNNSVSNGMCNAHNIRAKKGKDLSLPIRNRKSGTECLTCNKPLNGKGGWGLCTTHFKSKRIRVIKDACIKVLGGKCLICSGEFHRQVYDFHHHNDDKSMSPSVALANASVKAMSEEVAKCILVCANCHRLIHGEEHDSR